jgi:pimeloyl-ACP methyl ester carboxylesterase
MKPLKILGFLLAAVSGCLGNVQIRPVKTFSAIDYGLAEKYVTLGGIHLCYVDAGQGEDVLVFLHPAMSSLKVWQDAIREFQGRFRVVALDLPGSGKSDKPLRFRYHPEAFASVTARLLDHLGIRAATLIGNSNGGAAALAFALKYPERTRRLVLVGAAGIRAHAPWVERFLRWVLTPTHVATSNPYLTRFFAARALFVKETPRTDAFLTDFLSLRGSGDEYRRWVRAQAKLVRSVVSYDVSAELRRIEVPTLLLWGERDRLVPKEHALLAQKAIKGAELVLLPDVGHMPEVEVPQAFNKVLDGFLRRTQAAALRPAPPLTPKPAVQSAPERKKGEEDEEGDDEE